MKIAEVTKENITIEMTREEFLALDAVVMTAGLSWTSLDATAYDLTEGKLRQVVDGFMRLLEELERRRIARKKSS